MNNKQYWGEVASSSHLCNPALQIKAGQLLCYTSTTATKLAERRALAGYVVGGFVVGAAVYDKPTGDKTVSVYNGSIIPVRIQDGVIAADVITNALTNGAVAVSPAGEAVATGGSNANLRNRPLTVLFNSVANGVITFKGVRYLLCVGRD